MWYKRPDQSIEHSVHPAQGDVVKESLAVTFAKDQTQTLNIPVKVPIGGGRYAELTEWNGSKREDLILLCQGERNV
jgi:hypothetical protein